MSVFKEILKTVGLAEESQQYKTILLVDDDLDVREILAYALKQPGLTILEAESAEKALEILEIQKIDLLITDFYMPEINGAQLIHKCQKEGRYSGPIILISATLNEEIANQVAGYKLSGMLAKNQTEELQALISQTLVQEVGEIPSLSKS